MSSKFALSWAEWGKHDAVALAALVKQKAVTAAELAAQAEAAVARLNPKLEAVLEVFTDVIANPDADRPDRDGALYGVPMFLKDLGSGLKGRKQESGSKLYKDNIANATDPTVENYLRAGLVPIGRSTTPEFGMTFDTTTDYLGAVKVTRNPWNLAHTPGGSSGGSAAAVAAGVTPISMSSDGGGSTRIPASFSGLVGLKASRGRVPRPLAQSEYIQRISVDGVLTRSVRDSAAAFDYMTRVPNGGSFIKMGPPAGSYVDAIAREPGRLKIGLSTGAWGRGGATDAEVAERVRMVATLLEGLGHHVEEVADAEICDWETLWWGYITQWISCRGQPIAAAKAIPPANGPYSLLRDEELEPWVGRLADACRYTMPGNETGIPAISLPAGLDRDGLPVGIQLHGNFAREDMLLQIAAQVERARPEWFGAIPPVHVSRPD